MCRSRHKTGKYVLFSKSVDRRKTAVVAYLIAGATRAARLEDLSGLAQGRCHGFFREDVHVVLQGGQHCLGMQRVRRADIDRLDASLQERLDVGKGPREGESLLL